MSGLIQGLMDALLVWGTRSSDRSKMEAADVTEGALHVLEQGNGAGLRNPSSQTNSYAIRYEDWNITVVDLSTDAAADISSGVPARLGGIYVNTALSAHACPILDGATQKFVLPASLAAGTFVPLKGRFETSLQVNSNDAATGEVAVLWRPL